MYFNIRRDGVGTGTRVNRGADMSPYLFIFISFLVLVILVHRVFKSI